MLKHVNTGWYPVNDIFTYVCQVNTDDSLLAALLTTLAAAAPSLQVQQCFAV
jgi:hypothetical protein